MKVIRGYLSPKQTSSGGNSTGPCYYSGTVSAQDLPWERLPFSSHLSPWIWGKAKTASAEGHLPPISLPRSYLPSVSKGCERMQQRLIVQPKDSYMHTQPSEINVLFNLPAQNSHPNLQIATSARNSTMVWFASYLTKTLFQRGSSRMETTPCHKRDQRAWDLSQGPSPLGLVRRNPFQQSYKGSANSSPSDCRGNNSGL